VVVSLADSSGNPEIEVSHIRSTFTSSLEAEIEAIALATQQAANYYSHHTEEVKGKVVYTN